MSGGKLLAADLDGGNSIIFTEGETVIKSRLAENIYSVGCPFFYLFRYLQFC